MRSIQAASQNYPECVFQNFNSRYTILQEALVEIQVRSMRERCLQERSILDFREYP